MAGHSILGATDSVITSSSGRAVVPDSSFIQSISAIEYPRTLVPVMSESSHAPDSFPVPATWNHPLHPSYDRDVLNHPT